MGAGSLEQDLCFKSEVPLKFNTNTECQVSLDGLANYLDEDLKERNVSLMLTCATNKKTEKKTNVIPKHFRIINSSN